MAFEIAVASSSGSFRLGRNPFLGAKPISSVAPIWLFSPSIRKLDTTVVRLRRKPSLTVCFVVEGGKSDPQIESPAEDFSEENEKLILSVGAEERRARKKSERFTYSEMFGTFALSFGAAILSPLTMTSPEDYGGLPVTTKLRKYWAGEGENPITSDDGSLFW